MSAHASHTPPVVLVVDDDPGIRGIFSLAIGELGFQAVEAANGADALTKAVLFPPALIIVDQRMPGMTGIELSRRLRASGLKHVPIVLVSAGRDLERAAADAGVTMCLEKPFDVNQFINVIETQVRGLASAS